jgi:hypothetical protein
MVIKVDSDRPPIIVIPKGCQISEPSPLEIAKGRRPTKVVIVVISTGLNLSFPPTVTASSIDNPLARRMFM